MVVARRPSLRLVGGEHQPVARRRSWRQWVGLALCALAILLSLCWLWVPGSRGTLAALGGAAFLVLWAVGAWQRRREEAQVPIVGRLVISRRW